MTNKNTDLATQNNSVATQEKKPATPMQVIKNYFTADQVKSRFHEIMGKKSQGFIASVLQVVSQNDALQKVDPATIYQSAMMAATLDLPINQNLGFAYIIGYGNKATFQMGYKGYIQLAQRSGLFKTIAAAPIFEGQLVEQNPLTGFVFDFTKKSSEKILGYAAYFELLNGFSKTLFMTEKELNDHGTRFSQTFKKGFGLWKDDFNSMAIKTVLKLLLSKFAPLSIEMQRAVLADQAVIHDAETLDVDYVDNSQDFKTDAAQIEMDRLVEEINKATTKAELESLGTIPDDLLDLYNQRLTEVK